MFQKYEVPEYATPFIVSPDSTKCYFIWGGNDTTDVRPPNGMVCTKSCCEVVHRADTSWYVKRRELEK